MEHARQLLGFALLLTAVWLLWVLGQLTSVDGMAQALAFLCAVALAAWTWGRVQGLGAKARRITALTLVASLLLLGREVLPRATPAAAGRQAKELAWAPWTEESTQAALEAGRPVFVDFTADWCLTCKANERVVLAREDVQAAFKAHGVTLLKADWTKRDERIRDVLAKHGRAGVPLYLLFKPDAPGSPQVLPEVITQAVVLEALAGLD